MGKTVLVTGDVLLQENLLSTSPVRADGALDALTVQRSWGGAYRLAELAVAAIGDGIVVGPKPPEDPSRAFVVWAPFAPEKGETDDKKFVWRIEKHLGAQRSAAARQLTYSPARVDSPDVLLIEDLNLGFRDGVRLWPKALSGLPAKTSIVLRTSAPLGRGPLWKHVLKKAQDRLTVVVSADALRARSAGITTPLSWDQTIEEIASELEGSRFANDLALAKRVVVQFGSDGAASFTRLPLFGPRGPLLSDRVCFERCLYDPKNLEGMWKSRRPGLTPEGASILAAALARHELDPATYPLFLAIARGLAGIRRAHELGGGPAPAGPFYVSTDPIREILHPRKGELESEFYTAFPHCPLADEKLRDRPASKSDLLRDFTGSGFESVVSTGLDVVLRGVDKALKPVPKAVYGKYTTADRDEIERINAIRNLIVGYRDNPKDKRPLSFAVFGPPGSGKSFAVKQLMEEIVGKGAKSLEFNLSQMEGLPDLHLAFHKVRDESIQNQIPFVFWDEFDTQSLKWLKDFLAPMQDANFHAGGNQHLFGKAIFIFAGGVASTLAEFPKIDDFQNKKGSDFLSRLRGHIDVKGPNAEERVSGHPHVVRRAILLRKLLEANAPHLIDRQKILAMDPGVARAFLTVDSYKHGARSMEAIATMSNLAPARFYGLAELPTRDLLDMHVSPDFMAKADEPAVGPREIEILAIETQERYRAHPAAAGNVYAVPFADLPEEKRESNRAAMRGALVALNALGYRLVRELPPSSRPAKLQKGQDQVLKRLEHDRWLREVLLCGWSWHPRTVQPIRLNKHILPYGELSPKVHPFDILAAQVLLERLPKLGLALVQA